MAFIRVQDNECCMDGPVQSILIQLFKSEISNVKSIGPQYNYRRCMAEQLSGKKASGRMEILQRFTAAAKLCSLKREEVGEEVDPSAVAAVNTEVAFYQGLIDDLSTIRSCQIERRD